MKAPGLPAALLLLTASLFGAGNASADPDVILRLGGPATTIPAVPFTLEISLGNASETTAHDIVVTVDFRPDVGYRSFSPGCTALGAGRIRCYADSLPPSPVTPLFQITLIAPADAASGPIVFTGTVALREPDADPSSNDAQLTVGLSQTIDVTTTADDGGGSLRQAIHYANANCIGRRPCTIAFRIAGPSPNPWKTIRPASPLPALLAPWTKIDGANIDGAPVEISGGDLDGDGLVVTICSSAVANLVVNGFRRGYGISVIDPSPSSAANCLPFQGAELHHLYLGTDPTGSEARPNLRGIGISVANSDVPGVSHPPTVIHDCLISGNDRAGVFSSSGLVIVQKSRIGVKAHADEPLPNGAAGVFIGPGGYGSDVGNNVIAFNAHMAVAVAAGVADVSVRDNRTWENGGLGIDVGLDGPTASSGNNITAPVLTLAFYDPATKQTVIEGDLPKPIQTTFVPTVELFANDAPDPSGYGEGQRRLGGIGLIGPFPVHFRFAVDGDLTGQFITATATRASYYGFAKPGPKGITQGFLTQTSEFSRAIEVR
jgi:hypothetical protein